VQRFIQALLEDEVTELLGRGGRERRAGVDAPEGYRNGYSKPRRLTLGCGTVELRRPVCAGWRAGLRARATQRSYFAEWGEGPKRQALILRMLRVAETKFRRLNTPEPLGELALDVKSKDGPRTGHDTQEAAAQNPSTHFLTGPPGARGPAKEVTP